MSRPDRAERKARTEKLKAEAGKWMSTRMPGELAKQTGIYDLRLMSGLDGIVELEPHEVKKIRAVIGGGADECKVAEEGSEVGDELEFPAPLPDPNSGTRDDEPVEEMRGRDDKGARPEPPDRRAVAAAPVRRASGRGGRSDGRRRGPVDRRA